MSSSRIVVLAVLVALLVIAAVVVVVLRSRRHSEARREEAGALRGEAAVGVAGVHAQQQRADDLEHEAARAREKADLLESRAQEQRLAADHSAAQLEEAVREADRVDPDVDHRADDYAPDLDSPRADAEAVAAAAERRDEAAVRPAPTDPEDPDFRL